MPPIASGQRAAVLAAGQAPGAQQTLRVCTNRTCRRQGSQQVAQFAEDLQLAGLAVERTGCLGKCGAGPNVMLSPPDLVLGHVGTAARMTELLRSVAGLPVPDSLIMATELRMAGNAMARAGKLREAARLYSEGLAQEPPAGRHLLLSNRSGVLLSLGQAAEAAADADEAAATAPLGFRNAFIRQVEARASQQDAAAARQALESAVAQDPGFAQTPECAQLRRIVDSLSEATPAE